MLRVGLVTLALAALASSPTFAASTTCWQATYSGSTWSVGLPLTDDGCPFAVDIPGLSGTFAPGDDVPIVWNVAPNTASSATNALKFPLPANVTRVPNTDSSLALGQIGATFVRTCDSLATCDPTSKPAFTTKTQSGNLTSNGDPVLFKSLSGLRFDAPGDYVVGAFAYFGVTKAPSTAYVFATYTTISITADAAPKLAHEEGSVRCRMSRQSALNATLDSDLSASDGTACQVRLAVDPLPVVRPKDSLDVSFTATLDQSGDADVRMPTPVPQTEIDGKTYDIVSATVKLCVNETTCDEYTEPTDFTQVISAGAGSFSSNVAKFTAKNVVVPASGSQLAMLQVVIGGDGKRYDYIYYFELIATDADIGATVNATKYAVDGSTSYCWNVLADGTTVNVSSTSVAVAGAGDECPYTSTLSVQSVTLASDDTLDLSWTVAQSKSYSKTKFTNANLTTVYDANLQTHVSLPGLHLYACKDSIVCTPFTVGKTLLYSAPARNLTDGKAVINAEKVKFPGSGKFTLMAHTVFPDGASRIDSAAFATVIVASNSGKSHTVAYVLVSVGSVIAVIVIFFVVVWIRKRRHRQRMDKMVQFGLFGAPATRQATVVKQTESRSSVPSEHTAPVSFNYMQADRSPASAGEYPAFAGERKDSLSYDPYARSSFVEMSVNESNLSFAFTDTDRDLSFAHTDTDNDRNLSFAFTDGDRPSDDSEVYDV